MLVREFDEASEQSDPFYHDSQICCFRRIVEIQNRIDPRIPSRTALIVFSQHFLEISIFENIRNFNFGTDFVGSIFWKPEEERHERKCWKSAVFLLITWRIIISRRVRRLVIMDKDATCLSRLIQYPFESRHMGFTSPTSDNLCSGLLAAASKD